MKIIRALVLLVAALLTLWGALHWYYIYTPKASQPQLAGSYVADNLVVSDGIDRTFSYYLPSNLEDGGALIFVLHGSKSSAEAIRQMTGFEFDVFAESHQYIPVYANGFENHWNDCRASADYSANTQDIDDVTHIKSLIKWFVSRHRIDPSKVFVTGHSNGGHMAYKLALEAPQMIRAIAALSANLPVDDNFDCEKSAQPISVAIFNGTEDTINPYFGGTVKLGSNASRGLVRGSNETAGYWVQLAGLNVASPDRVVEYPETDGMSDTSVVAKHWDTGSGVQVRLYRLQGSGHVIPSKIYRFPRIIGPNASDISGPEEIVRFFEQVLNE